MTKDELMKIEKFQKVMDILIGGAFVSIMILACLFIYTVVNKL